MCHRRSAVERGFSARAGVAHECAGFNASVRFGVWIGTCGNQRRDHAFVLDAFKAAQRGVKRRFASVGQRRAWIGTLFDQEFAQSPVAVKGGGVEFEIGTKRGQRHAMFQQVPDS